MSPKHWTIVNGFSSRYHDWGGEGDDLYERLKKALKIVEGR
jgi:hypothetical protein